MMNLNVHGQIFITIIVIKMEIMVENIKQRRNNKLKINKC